MELQGFFLFLLKCECGRPIQGLTDIDQPSWWPSEVSFENDLLKKTSKKGVKFSDYKVKMSSSDFNTKIDLSSDVELNYKKAHPKMLFTSQVRLPSRIQQKINGSSTRH